MPTTPRPAVAKMDTAAGESKKRPISEVAQTPRPAASTAASQVGVAQRVAPQTPAIVQDTKRQRRRSGLFGEPTPERIAEDTAHLVQVLQAMAADERGALADLLNVWHPHNEPLRKLVLTKRSFGDGLVRFLRVIDPGTLGSIIAVVQERDLSLNQTIEFCSSAMQD